MVMSVSKDCECAHSDGRSPLVRAGSSGGGAKPGNAEFSRCVGGVRSPRLAFDECHHFVHQPGARFEVPTANTAAQSLA